MERLRRRVSATVDADAEAAAAAVAPRTFLRRGNSITASVVVPPKQLSVSLPIFSSSSNGSAAFAPPYQLHDIDLNGTSVAASLLHGSSSPPSSLSYSSLKDLLPQLSPAAVNSPTAASGRSGYEISIRNRLVKQAAWAYLQPMSGSPGSSGPSFLLRLWLRVCSPVNACLGFVSHHLIPAVARALCRILQTLLRCSTV